MLGVCYYPEHWPEEMWAGDAREMVDLGLDYVRIGEFAWTLIEPEDDRYDFAWLDRAIDTLASAGLKIVFGTPTATPPKWLIDKYPQILPVDPETGQARGFGSRRHYDFSSDVYLREALRITEVLTSRYGAHPAIVGWQTDNEISCHDTTLSASEAAKLGFQAWCKDRYGTIEALNEAWGNVFWSMQFPSFASVELPVGAVTETNPAHRLAFRRYSSDRVIAFHKKMVDVIRKNAPGKWVTHNFIPKEDLAVDTYAMGAALDFASYDNYPLGRADLAFADAPLDVFEKYMRTGHPDFASYYHDTSKSFAKGAFWVMEQQPGPVNWAPHNPRPAPGMIRLWSLEAFAHGAAVVSYFRWRQVPFAQEQMHAGLKRPDNAKASAWHEIEDVKREIELLGLDSETSSPARVAIVTDVQGQWVTEIQRQGAGYEYTRVEFLYYSALRSLGLDVDFISKDTAFDPYALIVVPCLPILEQDFVDRCKAKDALVLFGPRSGSKTKEFHVPDVLPPGKLQELIALRVVSVETLRADCRESISWQGRDYEVSVWLEELETDLGIAYYADGKPAAARRDNIIYLGAVPGSEFLRDFISALCAECGLAVFDLGDDLRISRRGALTFAFNYDRIAREVPAPEGADFLIGARFVEPRDVAVWRNGK